MPAELDILAAASGVRLALFLRLFNSIFVFMLVSIAHFAFVCTPTQWRPGRWSVAMFMQSGSQHHKQQTQAD